MVCFLGAMYEGEDQAMTWAAALAARRTDESTFTSASPSMTLTPLTLQVVSSTTRPRSAMTSRTLTVAWTVSAGAHRGQKLQVLIKVNSARAGQTVGDSRRNHAGRQKAVGDAPLNAVVAAYSSLIWMALQSPDTPANNTMSASVMVLENVALMPTLRSSMS